MVTSTRPRYGTREEVLAEHARAAESYAYFLRNHVYIAERNPSGDITGTIKWQWWPFHEELCRDLEERRLIVLKARQLGVSWALAARRVWEAMYTPHSLHGVVSAGEDEAIEFIWKCRFIIDHLPYEVPPVLDTDNSLELEFAASHGRILGFPSTPKAGRGYTFTTFTADEAAFHQYAARNYAAYSAATEGQIVIVSSAGDDERRAITDWFQRMWTAGAKGESGYTSRFYAWDRRPSRDAMWYEAKRAELATEPGQLEREYPSNPAEAFRSMLLLRFDADAIDRGLEYAGSHPPMLQPDGLPPTLSHPAVRVWATPYPGAAYVLGIDGAEGKGADYTVTHVLEARTLREVACIRERVMEPGEHGELSAALAKWYNNAWCMVERSHGEAIISVLRLRGCRVYAHRDNPDSERATVGFPMTAATRPGILADLAQVIKGNALSSADEAFWRECATFIVGDRKAEAAPGMHDDTVMAMALAVRMSSRPEAQTVQDVEYQRIGPVEPSSRGWV